MAISEKNLLRIVVPFFLFGFLGWAVNSGKVILLHRPHENLIGELAGLFWWMDIDHLQHYGFVLWFLPALFWARIIIFFVEKYLNINQVAILFLFLCLSFFSSSFFVLPLAFDKGLLALPWVFFGYLFNRYKKTLLGEIVWKVLIVIAIAMVLAYFGGILPLDMARKNIGDLYLSFPYTLSISYLIILLAYHVKHRTKISQWFLLMGKNSMLVLVFHPYINNFSHLLVGHYVNDGWYFKFFTSLLILVGVIAIKNRYHENIVFRFL